MKLHVFYGVLVCLLITHTSQAQQTFAVTDKAPVQVDGLEIGYHIKSLEEKEVGDKGNFSRYSVSFYVTNTTNQAKIMLYKQGFNLFNNGSNEVAQFNCLNATGARFTSKSATLNAEVCNVMALVDDKDPATNKTVQNKRFVQIGYWIKPGQTISTSAIMIVPLNEQLNMQVTYLAAQLQYLSSASIPGQMGQPMQQPGGTVMAGQTMSSGGQPMPSFTKIRNLSNNSYINTQGDLPASTTIESGWWSAQWLLIPVPGTSYYNIKNRWKEGFLAASANSVGLFADYMSDNARWLLEQVPGQNAFKVRNVAGGGYLCIASNQLKLANNPNNVFTANWAFEQP